MPAKHHSHFERCFKKIVTLALVSLALASASAAQAQAITNLHQLTLALNSSQQMIRDLDLEVTVCAASRPKVGVLIVQDESGSELLQIGDFGRNIVAGEAIRICRRSCLLRKREMGVEILAMPVVNNDGLHSAVIATGEARLPAGKIPLRLDWFNYWRFFALDVQWAISNEPPQLIEASNLWHAVATESGATNFLPGLCAEYYEGSWEALPDFNLLKPATTGVVTNFDLGIRSRNEGIGIRYSGYLDVPCDGPYRFMVRSDDGADLFLGDLRVPVVSLGFNPAPDAKPGKLVESSLTNLDERCWTVVEGNVKFVSQAGEGVRLDLGTDDRHTISARLADANGLDLSNLLNARVRITGVGRSVMTLDQTLMLGKLFVASAKDLIIVEHPVGRGDAKLPITSVAQVQSLPIERARQALPVRIRGTVTGATKTSQEHWMSFQDDTRGIFVRLDTITNAAPTAGELWEVEGHSAAGDFAPIIVADKATRLGEGFLPSPVNPTWTELLNGSRDVQWAELKGLVIDVHSNTISLYLPEGRLDVELEGSFESDLRPFLKANVRIRGVLYAVWDAKREVRVGRVMMRNSIVSVDVPAPVDPFDAVVRTPRELLLFDAQASAFRPVKVRGQIIYADATQLFLEDNGAGLRLLPVEKTVVQPGDLVEAVGYPDIGRTQLLLREVLLRKTGAAPLPPPRKLGTATHAEGILDSTRVRVEGTLLGWHAEGGAPVLEMRSGTRSYLARIVTGKSTTLSLRPGSQLALVGVYVGQGHLQLSNADSESFELLLNSLADITVLSQPSWWTLPRLLVLVGLLLVILLFTVIWNAQLRQVVEQRTDQLQHEIRERQTLEHQHALETERSRIARDLHDDLGSSLTEISVLASTGQLRQTSADHQPGLFQSIGVKARNLISALDAIVWAVDPEDNSLQSLADYLSGYAEEFFSQTQIACRFKVPVSFPPVILEGRVRHELLMAVKEALNNIMRHADANEVEFRMAMDDDRLEIEIADNGKGIAHESHGVGHGLKNLSARLQKLGGTCVVQPRSDGGTIVKFHLPLATARNASPAKADMQ